jgi:CRP-like cAMP-binding protein
MQTARISLLQGMAIFGGIKGEVLQFLLDRSTIVSLPAGAFYFREGDEGLSMFVLESGAVSILKGWNGEQMLLRQLGAGDCFGEMALMDLGPRSASALALQPCSAIELTTSSLFDVYQKDLEQFAMIEMNMGREVSRRLRVVDERLFRARVGLPDVLADYVIQSA